MTNIFFTLTAFKKIIFKIKNNNASVSVYHSIFQVFTHEINTVLHDYAGAMMVVLHPLMMRLWCSFVLKNHEYIIKDHDQESI